MRIAKIVTPTPGRRRRERGERAPMPMFDNPFDPRNRLTRGCSCGGHVSQLEHDRAAQLQCAPVETDSEDQRYQGVVASAVMRAMFPKDAARRAFLKSVGA